MAASDPKPLTVRCQCGNVSFLTPTAKPLALFHCHCTECQKQTSSAFGTSAIYTTEGIFPLSPDLSSKLKYFTRPTNQGRTMDCYFCTECGSRMFHRIKDPEGTPYPTLAIKGGCIDGLDWTGGKHIYLRSAVIKIPPEWEQYDTIP
ncbi:Mss4-like protein [Hypoxylon crocopeplum]|nr:Mss4-like protein [Hypoxylon crocopeplum]